MTNAFLKHRDRIDQFINKYRIGEARHLGVGGTTDKWRQGFFRAVKKIIAAEPPERPETYADVFKRARGLKTALGQLAKPSQDAAALLPVLDRLSKDYEHRNKEARKLARAPSGGSRQKRVDKFYNDLAAPEAFELLVNWANYPDDQPAGPYVKLTSLILEVAGIQSKSVQKACANYVRQKRREGLPDTRSVKAEQRRIIKAALRGNLTIQGYEGAPINSDEVHQRFLQTRRGARERMANATARLSRSATGRV